MSDLPLPLPAGCLLDALEGAPLERALSASAVVRCARGEVIYSPHDFRRCLGLILSGSVRVTKDTLIVSTLQTGDIFGAAALFSDCEEYATTLTAMSDCQVLFVPQAAVLELLRASPTFMERYVRYQSDRIRFLSRRLDTVSAGTAERRLAQFLLGMADPSGTLRISATALCRTLGVSRATLYRAFEVLEEDGAITRDGKAIRINDIKKLQSP